VNLAATRPRRRATPGARLGQRRAQPRRGAVGAREDGQGRILSTPRVSTQNNIEAEITQGIQIPIQTIANNTVTVSFRDAALTLKVTPQITAAAP
jgi:type II secretory pathway component HofQ